MVGLIDHLCSELGFTVQVGGSVKAIWMPDLHLFKPGFLDVGARCGGGEFEHRIIVRHAFFPHEGLRLW